LGKSSAPSAPDYGSLANQTAANNLANAQSTTVANRANQTTPYGSTTWTRNADGSWSQNTSLSPEQQQLYANRTNSQLGLGTAQSNLTNQVNQNYSQPFDMQSVQDVADKAYSGYTSRLDPQWQASQSQLENKLANQGIAPGTEAYTNAMRDFNAAKNDAYTSANTASLNLLPQTYNMAQSQYNQPLTSLNNVMSLTGQTNPTFQNYYNQNVTGGADVLGAGNASYNANLAGTNANNANTSNMYGGLLGLGNTVLGNWGTISGWF